MLSLHVRSGAECSLEPAIWNRSTSEVRLEDPAYREAARPAKSVIETNDVAERGVKMVSEYVEILTENGKTRQLLTQWVEHQ